MAKKVMKIEPVRQKVIQKLRPKKRVCAYCRVSTDSASQHNSYVAQVEYYKSYIEKHEDWEVAGIFADEAKSGTQVGKREEFLRMMRNAKTEISTSSLQNQLPDLQEIPSTASKP